MRAIFWGSPPKINREKTRIYRSPGDAKPIDVNDIRSEPGNTRLSQDDGSMHKANSLKLCTALILNKF